MRKDLLLSLRDVAIYQGHIANIYNDELIIYISQEDNKYIEDHLRIHIKLNEFDLSIYIPYIQDSFKVTSTEEDKLVGMFKTFQEKSKYEGLIHLSNKMDNNVQIFKESFFQYLEKERQTLSSENVEYIANYLCFENSILHNEDYVICDLTGTLPFLNLTTSLRGLPDGKVALIQKHSYVQMTIFDDVARMVIYINDCYRKAKQIISKWEKILGRPFTHSFRIEGNSFVFNQAYFSTNVNDMFLDFTDTVLESKNNLIAYFQKTEKELTEYMVSRSDLIVKEYRVETSVKTNKDSLSFKLFDLKIEHLYKTYQVEVDLEPMMNGYVLKINGNSSLVFRVNKNNNEEILENISLHINNYLEEMYKDFEDSIDIFRFIANYPELENDTGFISLVAPDVYRFVKLPRIVSENTLISTEISFTTTSFSKEKFLLNIKKLLKLNEQLKKDTIPLIEYFNYMRKYERNQLFIAVQREKLELVTPAGSFPFKVIYCCDGAILFKTINKTNQYNLYLESLFESLLNAIEAFEKQMQITYIFSTDPIKVDLLGAIFSRYSMDTNGLYENETTIDKELIVDYLEKKLGEVRFKGINNIMLPTLEEWKIEKIKEFQNNISSKEINFEYIPLTSTFLIKR